MGAIINKYQVMGEIARNRRLEKEFKDSMKPEQVQKVKPIFCVGLPYSVNHESIDSISNSFDKKMPEYHILVYLANNKEPIFNVFHEKPITDIEFEDLKELVLKTLQNGKA